jgi:putative membrane-bound dehydrogenase-like protein
MHLAKMIRLSSSGLSDLSWLRRAGLAVVAGLLLPHMSIAQVSPEASMKSFKVADGVEVTLFASEPMFSNPTDIDVDAYGRVWVCEGVNYRGYAKLRPEGDRIVILEDTDGDGKADKSTVFYQGTDINSALGICVLGNKVLVSCSPNVFLFTDTDGDGKADKKEIIFTGVGGVQHDHGMHTFVFGPDGKLYFNFGNEGKQIKTPDGKNIVDAEGNVVLNGAKHSLGKSGSYRQGMVFRCNPDFSEFETLGWNFRNNYEVSVDSFGTMWQSDNDDDGNRGVRINYVMEYGNYGYTDEISGAGWGSKRTNWETEIPIRHWHQNDPGVIPNLLGTGGGSPTGICIYEGNLLPKVFWNQMIHCDAGPNVVRAYPVTPDGAGYKASIVPIIQGGDQWFRPSDVCVAPDGSLMVADWYDPGVGGHGMGDNKLGSTRGRIFRVAPPGVKYTVPKFDLSTAAGAAEALTSPNLARRQLAWTALHEMGAKAESELQKLWSNDNPRLRARALNLLARINGKAEQYVGLAIKDTDADIRITGIRIARQLKLDVIPMVRALAHDPSPQVRRDCAIALRHSTNSDAADLWAELALQHDGKDRWYLEALGLAADRNEDAFFDAWRKRVGDNWNAPAGRDIIWRSRSAAVPALLATIIADARTPAAERLRYFRAFDFLPAGAEKEEALVKLLNVEQPDVALETVTRLRGSAKLAGMKETVNKVLDSVRGTPELIDLVDQLDVKDRNADVLAVAIANSNDQAGASAMRVLLKNGDRAIVEKALAGKDAAKVVSALAGLQDNRVVTMLAPLVSDAKQEMSVRKLAVRGLARSRAGAQALFEMVKSNVLGEELLATVARELHGSSIREIRADAQKLMPLPPTKDGKPLPPLTRLLEMKGDAASGTQVFQTICFQCHQVNGQGTNFGPPLSEVGSKLGRDALYTSILYPSAAIEHNYVGNIVKVKSGDEWVGIIQSEIEAEIQLRIAGGIVMPIKKSEIVSRKEMKESIMPEELQKSMTAQDLADVVEYLSTLKKK